jgi:hypothetical protein
MGKPTIASGYDRTKAFHARIPLAKKANARGADLKRAKDRLSGTGLTSTFAQASRSVALEVQGEVKEVEVFFVVRMRSFRVMDVLDTWYPVISPGLSDGASPSVDSASSSSPSVAGLIIIRAWFFSALSAMVPLFVRGRDNPVMEPVSCSSSKHYKPRSSPHLCIPSKRKVSCLPSARVKKPYRGNKSTE